MIPSLHVVIGGCGWLVLITVDPLYLAHLALTVLESTVLLLVPETWQNIKDTGLEGVCVSPEVPASQHLMLSHAGLLSLGSSRLALLAGLDCIPVLRAAVPCSESPQLITLSTY